MSQETIVFISTMSGSPWGGSEELWAQTAKILAGDGFNVKASVQSSTPLHPRLADLAKAGVELCPYPSRAPILAAIARRLQDGPPQWRGLQHVRRLLARTSPGLVVLSEGANFPPIELVELLASSYNFVTISHNNCELWWPDDETASRLRKALARSRRCYFVSEANRHLAKMQIGSDLENSSIVRNPYNVNFDISLTWPKKLLDDDLIFSCVGRLDPKAKGQDLLIEALSKSPWPERKWRLNLYGSGPMKETLERLVDLYGLSARVNFAGHVENVPDIWKDSHILVQPSRHEGLPLSVVEAMLCGRPVIATDVAGHAEVVLDGVTGFLAKAPIVVEISDALERAWVRRSDLREMGQAAAERIRSIMPRNPDEYFAKEICKYVCED